MSDSNPPRVSDIRSLAGEGTPFERLLAEPSTLAAYAATLRVCDHPALTRAIPYDGVNPANGDSTTLHHCGLCGAIAHVDRGAAAQAGDFTRPGLVQEIGASHVRAHHDLYRAIVEILAHVELAQHGAKIPGADMAAALEYLHTCIREILLTPIVAVAERFEGIDTALEIEELAH